MITDTMARKSQNLAEQAKRRFGTPGEYKPNNHLVRRRALECFALTMIGDGTLGFIEPVEHVQLWLRGPKWWRQMLQPFADNPELTRWVGAAEFALGVWLARKQATAD